jgi:hypothetical protein
MVKILFISGSCAEAELKDPIDQYNAKFLAKPFRMPVLLATVDDTLKSMTRTARVRRARDAA